MQECIDSNHSFNGIICNFIHDQSNEKYEIDCSQCYDNELSITGALNLHVMISGTYSLN